jgi:hypothetical protein
LAGVDEDLRLQATRDQHFLEVPVELPGQHVTDLGAHDEDVFAELLLRADAADRAESTETEESLVGNRPASRGRAQPFSSCPATTVSSRSDE